MENLPEGMEMSFLLFWRSLSIKPVSISRALLHTRPWLKLHVLKTSFKSIYFLSAPVLSTTLRPWIEDTENPACKRKESSEGQLPAAEEDLRPHWTLHQVEEEGFHCPLEIPELVSSIHSANKALPPNVSNQGQ